jgi:hypothetical protein
VSVNAPPWPPEFRQVLSKLAAGGREYFGTEQVSFEPVRRFERPFSTLLQVRVGGSTTSDDAFVKILKPRADTPEQIASMRENVVKDFEMTNRVHQQLAAYPGLTAVKPIACFPEDLAIVTEEARGEMLSAVLSRGAAGFPREKSVQALESIMRRIGSWLTAAQAVLPCSQDVSPEKIRLYLERRLDALEAPGRWRLTPAGRSAIDRHVDRLLASESIDLTGVWIHADFCPENIITRDGRITVLDFTMAKSGTIYHDISHLYFRLDVMCAKPWFREGVIRRLQHALLNSFETGLDPHRPLFELMLLQHVLCHLVELQSPRSAVAEMYADRLHARHRRWLAAVAGVDHGSWVR